MKGLKVTQTKKKRMEDETLKKVYACDERKPQGPEKYEPDAGGR